MSPVFPTVVLAFLIALAAMTTAEAQPRGRRARGPFGFRGMADGLASLASIPEIQKEIELTSQQRELLEALQDDLSNQFRTRLRREFRGRSGGPRDREERDLLRQSLETVKQQGDDLVASILEPQQTKRLQELHLQREGIRAFDRADFVEQLGLTNVQIEKIGDIREPNSRDDSGPRESRDEVQGSEGSKTVDDQVLAALTGQQKETWDKMKGETFEFPHIERRRSSRGRRRPDRPFRPRPEE